MREKGESVWVEEKEILERIRRERERERERQKDILKLF